MNYGNGSCPRFTAVLGRGGRILLILDIIDINKHNIEPKRSTTYAQKKFLHARNAGYMVEYEDESRISYFVSFFIKLITSKTQM